MGGNMGRAHPRGTQILDREEGNPQVKNHLSGADDGIRTRDPHLGKVVLYQLSHVRACSSILGASSETFNRSDRAPSRKI